MRHTVEILTGDSKKKADRTNLGYLGSSKPGPKESVIVTFDGNSTEVDLSLAQIEKMTHALGGNWELALVYLALNALPVFSHSLHELWLSQFEQRLWRDPKEGGFRVTIPPELKWWVEAIVLQSADSDQESIEDSMQQQLLRFVTGYSNLFEINTLRWDLELEPTILSRIQLNIKAGYSSRSGGYVEARAEMYPSGALVESGDIWTAAQQSHVLAEALKKRGFLVEEEAADQERALLISTPHSGKIKISLGYVSEQAALASNTQYERGMSDPIIIFAMQHLTRSDTEQVQKNDQGQIGHSYEKMDAAFFQELAVVISHFVDVLHGYFNAEIPDDHFDLSQANNVS